LIIIHPHAAVEAQAARAWYATRNHAVGMRFLAEYDRAINRIRDDPGAGPRTRTSPDTARFTSSGFPMPSSTRCFLKAPMSWPWHTTGDGRGTGESDALAGTDDFVLDRQAVPPTARLGSTVSRRAQRWLDGRVSL
jgi:hypothetical protein